MTPRCPGGERSGTRSHCAALVTVEGGSQLHRDWLDVWLWVKLLTNQ